MTTPPSLLVAALDAHIAGLCVIPAATNGLKQPWPDGPAWDAYKSYRPTIDQLNRWFGAGRYDGLGYVCGAVSNNLELLELEGRAVTEGALDTYTTLLADHGLTELWQRIATGYTELTPSGGIHVLYRVDGQVSGNTRLAKRPAREEELTNDERELLERKPGKVISRVLLETRGEGGFVIAAPSAGRTHPSGKPWVLAGGSLATIATVTEHERDALHAIASMLDVMPAIDAPAGAVRTTTPALEGEEGQRPGDDYNAKVDWREILEPHGWRHVRNFGTARGWLRPGKGGRGISATTGTNGGDNLYVFSSSTEFETEQPYSKFSAYALLEHAGDFSAAARALRAQGYGGPLPARDEAAELQALIAPVQGPPPFAEGSLAPVYQLHPDQEGGEQPPLTPQDAQALAYEREVEHELRKIRVREEAARRMRKARAGGQAPPVITMLDDFLAVADEPAEYRITGLWPKGGRIVLAAQFKAGKTTLVGNLVRSLVDSTPFLGRYEVAPFAGRVVILDNELDERMLRRWLRDQGIENTAAVAVLPLRGKLSSFDLLDPQTRTEWADRLRAAQATVVVFDCLAPLLDALGLSEDKEAGRLLVAFDEFLKEAGVQEAIVVHHMGHSGERSRGASRLRDWPDAEWRLVREKSDDGETDPSAPRYFSAYGRDVDVSEGLLEYDPARRRLSLVGGSRRDARAAEVLPDLFDYLTKHPASSKNVIEKALGRHTQKDLRKALAAVVEAGKVVMTKGHRNADLHSLAYRITKSQFVSSSEGFQRTDEVPVRQFVATSSRTESEFVSSSIEDELNSRGGDELQGDELNPPPGAPTRTKDGRLGQCRSCGGQMVILTPGQTLHPMCEPQP